MCIDTIGPFVKSVEGHHYGLVARHTQDETEGGETTNDSNFLIILGMTTKAEALNAVQPHTHHMEMVKWEMGLDS